jgi:hypothetical protein
LKLFLGTVSRCRRILETNLARLQIFGHLLHRYPMVIESLGDDTRRVRTGERIDDDIIWHRK